MDYALIIGLGMGTLLGWGLYNAGIGIWRQKHPSENKRWFWQMNTGWGIVNSIIGAYALYTLFGQINAGAIPQQTISDSHRLLLINSVLDVFYVLLGLLLIKKAKAPKKINQKLRMYGWAIVIQGAFLFLLDTTLVLFI